MSTKKTLSICIATYNRANYLRQALASVKLSASQVKDCLELEFCISDNSSNSDTEKLVNNELRSENFTVKYVKNSTNVGLPENIIRAISLGTGDYYWILGDDDTIVPAGLKILSDMINDNPRDWYLINRVICDKNLVAIRNDKYLKVSQDMVFSLNTEKNIVSYLNKARTLDALFCFITSLVIKKEIALHITEEAKLDKFYSGNLFPHTYFMWGYVMKYGCDVFYYDEPLVNFRGGNSSKEADSELGKWLINFHELSSLFRRIASNNDKYKYQINSSEFLKVLRRCHALKHHLSACSKLNSNDEISFLVDTIKLLDYSRSTMFIYLLAIEFRFVLKLLRKLMLK